MILILFPIIFLFCFIFDCVWLITIITRDGYRKFFGYIAINISMSLFMYSIIFHGVLAALFSAIFPSLSFLIYFLMLLSFSEFISQFITEAILIGLIVFVAIQFIKSSKNIKAISFFIGFSVFLCAGLILGERVSQKAMCAAAKELGFDEVERNTLFWSIGHARQEFQFTLHAELVQSDKIMGWSYGTLSFYEVPELASSRADGSIFHCT